jgi:putative transposase
MDGVRICLICATIPPGIRPQEARGAAIASLGGGVWTPQQVSLRSQIVLAAAAGESDSAIARDLRVNRNTVILWRNRFVKEGLDGFM